MKKVLFATENESKIKRFKEIFLKNNIEIISIKDLKEKKKIHENGHDVLSNALLKAKAYSNLNIPVFATDDSLYLEGVPDNLQPGLFVRRINNKTLNDQEMIDYYKNLVNTYSNGKLNCMYIYGVALIKDGVVYTKEFYNKDIYLVSEVSSKINPGYPLNSISKDLKTNEYLSNLNNNNSKTNQEIIDFLLKNIK